VQEDPLHVFIVMGMTVSMAVIVAFVSVIVRVPMAMMSMSKGCETDNIDEEAKNTDDEQLI
jgi:hypothetical protein